MLGIPHSAPVPKYEQVLQDVRDLQNQAAAAHPIADVGGQVTGVLATAPMLPSAVGARVGIGAKLGQMAVEGAGYGGLSSFGAGEGGSGSRLEDAAKGAALGAVLSPAVGGTLQAAGKGLGYLANRVAPPSIQDEAVQLLKPGAVDFKKAARFKGDAGEQALLDALEGAKARGVLDVADIGQIGAKNEEVMNALGAKADDLLKAADAAGKGSPSLSFDNAYKFIAEHPFEEQQLVDQFKRRMAVIGEKWDGTVSGLNQLKRQIGKRSFRTEADSKAFDRVLYSDLRSTVERGADLAGDGTGKAVKEINRQLGQHYDIADLIEKASNRTAAAELRAPKQLGITSLPVLSTIGALGSAATGDITPLLLAIGAKGTQGALNSKAGAAATSQLLGSAGSLADAAARLANPAAMGALSEGLTGAERPAQAGTTGQQPAAPTLEGAALQMLQKQLQQKGPAAQETSSNELYPSVNSLSASAAMQAPGSYREVSPDLSNAVQYVESRGNPKAESSKGAIGTHQVTPIAARDVLRARGVDDSQLSDEQLKEVLRQPGMSKVFGEAYLRLLIARYDGNIELALAAYNGGPSRLDRKGKNISAMPAETRAYVPLVLSALTRGQA